MKVSSLFFLIFSILFINPINAQVSVKVLFDDSTSMGWLWDDSLCTQAYFAVRSISEQIKENPGLIDSANLYSINGQWKSDLKAVEIGSPTDCIGSTDMSGLIDRVKGYVVSSGNEFSEKSTLILAFTDGDNDRDSGGVSALADAIWSLANIDQEIVHVYFYGVGEGSTDRVESLSNAYQKLKENSDEVEGSYVEIKSLTSIDDESDDESLINQFSRALKKFKNESLILKLREASAQIDEFNEKSNELNIEMDTIEAIVSPDTNVNRNDKFSALFADIEALKNDIDQIIKEDLVSSETDEQRSLIVGKVKTHLNTYASLVKDNKKDLELALKTQIEGAKLVEDFTPKQEEINTFITNSGELITVISEIQEEDVQKYNELRQEYGQQIDAFENDLEQVSVKVKDLKVRLSEVTTAVASAKDNIEGSNLKNIEFQAVILSMIEQLESQSEYPEWLMKALAEDGYYILKDGTLILEGTNVWFTGGGSGGSSNLDVINNGDLVIVIDGSSSSGGASGGSGSFTNNGTITYIRINKISKGIGSDGNELYYIFKNNGEIIYLDKDLINKNRLGEYSWFDYDENYVLIFNVNDLNEMYLVSKEDIKNFSLDKFVNRLAKKVWPLAVNSLNASGNALLSGAKASFWFTRETIANLSAIDYDKKTRPDVGEKDEAETETTGINRTNYTFTQNKPYKNMLRANYYGQEVKENISYIKGDGSSGTNGIPPKLNDIVLQIQSVL